MPGQACSGSCVRVGGRQGLMRRHVWVGRCKAGAEAVCHSAGQLPLRAAGQAGAAAVPVEATLGPANQLLSCSTPLQLCCSHSQRAKRALFWQTRRAARSGSLLDPSHAPATALRGEPALRPRGAPCATAKPRCHCRLGAAAAALGGRVACLCAGPHRRPPPRMCRTHTGQCLPRLSGCTSLQRSVFRGF